MNGALRAVARCRCCCPALTRLFYQHPPLLPPPSTHSHPHPADVFTPSTTGTRFTMDETNIAWPADKKRFKDPSNKTDTTKVKYLWETYPSVTVSLAAGASLC